MSISIHPSRNSIITSELAKPYFADLQATLAQETQAGHAIYPVPADIFKAFDLTPRDTLSVVILGQDPYHQPGQAMGLAFSVPSHIPKPPSLQNIYKELAHQYPWYNTQQSWDLTRRAQQWVLLLNTSLTVRAHEPASHSTIGRQQFTDHSMASISQQKSWLVFLLRGRHAQSKTHLIDTSKHLVLTASHPSPLSAHRGRFGNNHFIQTNEYLIQQWKKAILW